MNQTLECQIHVPDSACAAEPMLDPELLDAHDELAPQDAPRVPGVEALRLEVVARMAVYEAIALSEDRSVDAIEAARAALQQAIDRLVIEAHSKAVLERRFKALWAERLRLEAALGCLVPQGRMGEAVGSRLQRAEARP